MNRKMNRKSLMKLVNRNMPGKRKRGRMWWSILGIGMGGLAIYGMTRKGNMTFFKNLVNKIPKQMKKMPAA
ncbi:hypothetical protein [Caldibacillus debilis]|uniref:hypothetical protein n=1 Tax=Caldibacillus debilis TaxID=301148 RepID=UPI00037D01E5|nr:hypothetical protein [Caldibacillus debilis]MBO2480660.1 hypothetical protein [Bacillaceae bacterium]